MNPLIELKSTILPLLITFTLPWFGLSPTAQAVVPPPDGGYPNFTTAEGTKALQNLTTGSANAAVGWFSLVSVTTGSFNTATGAGSLLFNTADHNAAFGAAALLFNTTGGENTATGAFAFSATPRATLIRPPVFLRFTTIRQAAASRAMVPVPYNITLQVV